MISTKNIGKMISIHALVKRATWQDTVIRNCRKHFNPRPREEGDQLRLS